MVCSQTSALCWKRRAPEALRCSATTSAFPTNTACTIACTLSPRHRQTTGLDPAHPDRSVGSGGELSSPSWFPGALAILLLIPEDVVTASPRVKTGPAASRCRRPARRQRLMALRPRGRSVETAASPSSSRPTARSLLAGVALLGRLDASPRLVNPRRGLPAHAGAALPSCRWTMTQSSRPSIQDFRIRPGCREGVSSAPVGRSPPLRAARGGSSTGRGPSRGR